MRNKPSPFGFSAPQRKPLRKLDEIWRPDLKKGLTLPWIQEKLDREVTSLPAFKKA
jgi:hypothetical protein